MPRFTRTPGNWFLADNATICGDVTIGELSSFWFNAVVRGDVAPITIGRRVNVQDAAVIHCDTGVPNVIEDDVTIGHGAIVHGMFVGQGSHYEIWDLECWKQQLESLRSGGTPQVPPGMENFSL